MLAGFHGAYCSHQMSAHHCFAHSEESCVLSHTMQAEGSLTV